MKQLAIGTAAALLVGYVALVGAALLQIFRAPIPHALRLGWFAAVVLAPPFGVLAWLLFGHPAAPFPVARGHTEAAPSRGPRG